MEGTNMYHEKKATRNLSSVELNFIMRSSGSILHPVFTGLT